MESEEDEFILNLIKSEKNKNINRRKKKLRINAKKMGN
jgi:hypothetical protein